MEIIKDSIETTVTETITVKDDDMEVKITLKNGLYHEAETKILTGDRTGKGLLIDLADQNFTAVINAIITLERNRYSKSKLLP